MSVTVTCICHKTHIFKVIFFILTIHGSFNKKIIFIFVKKILLVACLWLSRKPYGLIEKWNTLLKKNKTLSWIKKLLQQPLLTLSCECKASIFDKCEKILVNILYDNVRTLHATSTAWTQKHTKGSAWGSWRSWFKDLPGEKYISYYNLRSITFRHGLKPGCQEGEAFSILGTLQTFLGNIYGIYHQLHAWESGWKPHWQGASFFKL